MTEKIDAIQDAIVEEIQSMTDPLERYEYLIATGKKLAPFPEEAREEYALPGCQSAVWLKTDKQADGSLRFTIDSDTQIIRGIIALLLRVIDGRSPAEISQARFYFLEDTGLAGSLSPGRAEGIQNIIKHIQEAAESQALF